MMTNSSLQAMIRNTNLTKTLIMAYEEMTSRLENLYLILKYCLNLTSCLQSYHLVELWLNLRNSRLFNLHKIALEEYNMKRECWCRALKK